MNFKRLLVALSIVVVSYFYFRLFGIRNHPLAHLVFALFIGGSMVVAFLTKQRDITAGILYGLIFVLFSMLLTFIFFSSLLE